MTAITLPGEHACAAPRKIGQASEHIVHDQQRRVGRHLPFRFAAANNRNARTRFQNALPTKSVAVVARRHLMAKNASPRPTVRVSVEIPGTSLRQRARAIRAHSQLPSRRCVQRARVVMRLPAMRRDTASWSENGNVLVPTIWPSLVALARNPSSTSPDFSSETAVEIACPRSPISTAPGAAAENSLADRGSFFRSRVVVGDDDDDPHFQMRWRPSAGACPCRGRRLRRNTGTTSLRFT